MDDTSNDDSFLNSNAHKESTDKQSSNAQGSSFNKVSSIDRLSKNKTPSKSRDNISNNVSNLQQEVIQEEAMDQVPEMDELPQEVQIDVAINVDDEPEEVAQVIEPGKQDRQKPWKRFTNENDSSDDEVPDSQIQDNQLDSQMPSFTPANPGLYNNRRVMTAPEGSIRRKYGKKNQDRAVIGGAFPQTFVENDLMKAANIYQQFDKKGNLYENRLYAKTSINQAKFNKDQSSYDMKMENHADENARINNGSAVIDKDEAELSLTQHQKSSVNGTQNVSVSINGQLKSSSNTVTNGFVKSRIRVSTGLGISRGKISALSPRLTEMRQTQLMGGNIMGGTFSKSNAPKIARKGEVSKATLYDKVEAQANQNNRDMSMTKTQRGLSNTQFSNIKKSLGKLQSLNIQTATWSRKDYDPKYVAGGIGGKQNIFEMAQNLNTNDPMMFKEKGYNDTSNNFSPGSQNKNFLKTFYHYYGEESGSKTIKVHDKLDKQSAFGVGRYVNSSNRNFYSKQLDNKGNSKVAFTQREHAAGYAESINKIQTKAYRGNTQSRQVDGLYKEAKFTARPSYMNHTRSEFNILRPCHNARQMSVSTGDPKKLMEALRAGKCHQMYGVSDFNQNNRISGIRYHEKYQASYSQNEKMFRRQNGEFTAYSNNLQHCKF